MSGIQGSLRAPHAIHADSRMTKADPSDLTRVHRSDDKRRNTAEYVNVGQV